MMDINIPTLQRFRPVRLFFVWKRTSAWQVVEGEGSQSESGRRLKVRERRKKNARSAGGPDAGG